MRHPIWNWTSQQREADQWRGSTPTTQLQSPRHTHDCHRPEGRNLFNMRILKLQYQLWHAKYYLKKAGTERVTINCVSFCWGKKIHDKIYKNKKILHFWKQLDWFVGFSCHPFGNLSMDFIKGGWHKPGISDVRAKESLTILRCKCFEETKSPFYTVYNNWFLGYRFFQP